MFTRPASKSSRLQLQLLFSGYHGRTEHRPARGLPHTSLVETMSSPKNKHRRRRWGVNVRHRERVPAPPCLHPSRTSCSPPAARRMRAGTAARARLRRSPSPTPSRPDTKKPGGHAHPYVSARRCAAEAFDAHGIALPVPARSAPGRTRSLDKRRANVPAPLGIRGSAGSGGARPRWCPPPGTSLYPIRYASCGLPALATGERQSARGQRDGAEPSVKRPPDPDRGRRPSRCGPTFALYVV